MKINLPVVIALAVICNTAISQTNTFPSSGSVGIGTASPGAKLDLQAAGNTKLFTFGTSSSGTGYHYGLWMNSGAAMITGIESSTANNLFYGSLAYSSVWGTNNATAMHFSPNNQVAMTLVNGGKIGIGTTSPVWKLDINSLQESTDGLRFSGVNHAYLSVKTTAASGYSAGVELSGGASGANWIMMTNRGDLSSNADDLIFYKNIAGTGATGAKVTLRSNGAFGIGTTNPADKLVIQGFNSSSATEFGNTSTGENYMFSYNRATSAFQAFDFYTSGSTPTIHLGATGYVGIGTTSPKEKFSVNGNITAKKMIVTQSGWSDYVFNDDYKLRSLSSLQTFIKKNKRLPEIPSAIEVEENGVSVGDNQALLLKKIEELTLYILQLEEKTDRQQAQINRLMKKSRTR